MHLVVGKFGVWEAQKEKLFYAAILAKDYRKSMYRRLKQHELLKKLFWVSHY